MCQYNSRNFSNRSVISKPLWWQHGEQNIIIFNFICHITWFYCHIQTPSQTGIKNLNVWTAREFYLYRRENYDNIGERNIFVLQWITTEFVHNKQMETSINYQ